MTSTSESLWAAIDRLEGGEKWGRGMMFRPYDGSRCLLGAIGNISKETGEDYSLVRNDPALDKVAEVIADQFPDRIPVEGDRGSMDIIWYFNDHNATEFDDVRLVLEKAAIKTDEYLA